MPSSVLVVAEDVPIRSYIVGVLEAEGFDVETVSTAQAGFDRLLAAPQRMVAVFDFTLPDTDLDRTLLTLMTYGTALQRHSYVVLTSRAPKRDVEMHAEMLGVQLVQIPFMMDHLAQILRDAQQRLAT